jgi:hypothetical protein
LRSAWIYWSLKMGRIDCPETSGRNYHYRLHNIPQDLILRNSLIIFVILA